jgi:hypothetical protein
MMSRKCEHCGEAMPENKRSDSHYCSDKCRKYASRKRKENGTAKIRKVGKGPLSGLPVAPIAQPQIPVPKKKEPEKSAPVIAPAPVKEPELTYAMMPPLRGYVEDAAKVNLAKLPPPPEPPAVFDEAEPQALQPEYKQYSLSVPNPEYKQLSDLRNSQLLKIQKQQQLASQHEQVFKQIEQSTNMNGLKFVLFTAGGGLIGGELAGNNKRVEGMTAGAVTGFLAALIINWATADQFKKDKAEALANQKKLVLAARSYLIGYRDELASIENALSKRSEMLSVPHTKLLNGDSIKQNEREIEEYQNRKAASEQLWEKYHNEVAEYEARYGSIEAVNEAFAKAEEMPKAEVNDSGVVSSLGLNKVVGGALLFKGPWRTFFGAPSRDFKLVIHGPSFSGKSHLTLQFAYYLAIHHGTVLYNTSEEGFSRTLDEKLEKLGARAKGLDIGRYTTVKELKEKIPRTVYNFIVLDSVSDMNMSAEDLQELRRHYCCSAIIGICQNTKSGDIRGGYDLVHDADIKIRVQEDKVAYTDKNRFLDDHPQLEIFKISPVPVTAKAEGLKQQAEGGKIILLHPEVNQESEKNGTAPALPPGDPGTKDDKPDSFDWSEYNDLGEII